MSNAVLAVFCTVVVNSVDAFALLEIPSPQPHGLAKKGTGPLCTNGQVWKELHISAGDNRGLELSGMGTQIQLNCFSGFIWDLYSGHPTVKIELFSIETGASVDITNQVNTTYWNSPRAWQATTRGKWGLKVTNNNMLWNADFTLVVAYKVQDPAFVPQNCSLCPTAGTTGPQCNQQCNSDCFGCCQSNANECVICNEGHNGLPSCSWDCMDNCHSCDDMAGCQVCKSPLASGPNCDQCRPSTCYNPDLTNCNEPCPEPWPSIVCEMCEEAVEKGLSIIKIAGDVYKEKQAAKKALAAAAAACLLLPPVVDIGCDFSIGAVAEGASVSYLINWAGVEVMKKLTGGQLCRDINLCSGKADLVV